MKKKQAKKLLDKAVLALGDNIAELVFEAQVLIHTYKAVRVGETITYNTHNRRYTHQSLGEWWHKVSAYDITQSNWCLFCMGGRRGNQDTYTKRFPQTLNSQFRWLLVSGYEAYERYLKDLYTILGYCDQDLWRCADYGNRYHPNNISSMTLADYRERVRASNELTPEKIRNQIGCIFPSVQSAEVQNSIRFGDEKMSFRDYVDFIALLRHVIVHEQARITFDDFFRRLSAKWGRKPGITRKLQTLILHSEFREDGEGYEVWLLPKNELALQNCTSMDSALCVLLERLGTHGHLLYKKSIEHFGGRAYWEG